MKRLLITCASQILIFFIFFGGASAYGPGTSVKVGDNDNGHALVSFVPPNIPQLVYTDAYEGTQYCYDLEDYVYLHFGSSPVIAVGDIRLAPDGPKQLNPLLNPQDATDVGRSYVPTIGGIYFMGLHNSACGFDSDDPIYAIIGRFPEANLVIRVNDIRLSPGDLTYPAGQKVEAGGTDQQELFNPVNRLIAFNPDYLPISSVFRFYNANGNYAWGKPLYDIGDEVYIDMQFVPGIGHVDPGDIRLTEVV